MTKLERAFFEAVHHNVKNIRREPIKFRLAGRTWYTPDFIVQPWSGNGLDSCMSCIEVKGFMRDDASVKLKVAAETYPCLRWLLVTRSGRHGWSVREVGRTGIGTHDIQVPWIGDGA